MILEYDESLTIVASIGYAISLLITLVLYKFLGHKDLKTRRLPLIVLTFIILLFEILKQIKNLIPGQNAYLMTFKNDGSQFSGYALPFHLCSFFIFFPVLALVTKGKAKDFFENMTLVWAVSITAFTVLYPQSVYGDQVRSFYRGEEFQHSIFFHQSAVLYLMLACALKPFDISIKKIWYVPLGFLLYAAIAVPMAFIFDANYCSILSCDFFPIIDTIRVKYGYFVYLPILLMLGFAFGCIMYLIALFVKKMKELINCENGFFIGLIVTTLLLTPIAFLYVKLNGDNMKYIYVLLLELIVPSAISILAFKLSKKTR